MTQYRSSTDASHVYHGNATADHAGSYGTSDPASFADVMKNSIMVNVSAPVSAPTILPFTPIDPKTR